MPSVNSLSSLLQQTCINCLSYGKFGDAVATRHQTVYTIFQNTGAWLRGLCLSCWSYLNLKAMIVRHCTVFLFSFLFKSR